MTPCSYDVEVETRVSHSVSFAIRSRMGLSLLLEGVYRGSWYPGDLRPWGFFLSAFLYLAAYSVSPSIQDFQWTQQRKQSTSTQSPQNHVSQSHIPLTCPGRHMKGLKPVSSLRDT